MNNIGQIITEYINSMKPLVKPLGSRTLDSIHMVSGAITELFIELGDAVEKEDDVNVIEELGDAFFYLSQLAVIHNAVDSFINGFVSLEIIPVTNDETVTYGMKALLEFTDINKGCLVYNREYDQSVTDGLIYNLGREYAIMLQEEFGDKDYVTTKAVLKKNYEKLHKVRYKNGYSDDSANNRDLDAERKALED